MSDWVSKGVSKGVSWEEKNYWVNECVKWEWMSKCEQEMNESVNEWVMKQVSQSVIHSFIHLFFQSVSNLSHYEQKSRVNVIYKKKIRPFKKNISSQYQQEWGK